MKIATLEQRLSESFLRDARKRRNRSEKIENNVRVVTVQVSGVTVGLAYAIESITGEKDALARVIERLDPDITEHRLDIDPAPEPDSTCC